MLRHSIENNSNNDEVELSRRSFFGRLAIGAVLSLAMPSLVNAAKNTSAKTGKDKRLTKSVKSGVRLPKQASIKNTKPSHNTGKALSVSHREKLAKSVKSGKLSKSSAAHKHKSAAFQHKQLHTASAKQQQQDKRVRDIYHGKNLDNPIVANSNLDHDRRVHSVIQPAYRDSNPNHEATFLADHSRFASHRALAFQNPHTGDKLSLTYFEKGRYLSDALDEISFLLRDYRTGDVHPIDPELLDQLHDLKQILGLRQPFGVICGYRSPLTNAKLHAENAGVANNSFHIHGRAVDIRIERFDLRRIHGAALAMHRGGVGYYPQSNFIHLDTGTFRTWTL